MSDLKTKIGYSFKNPQLLKTALTHSSYANEDRVKRVRSNERLEFLGDSVLGMIVAEHLYLNFPDIPEGSMTRLRAELVCEQSLYGIAADLELGRHLLLGKGEENTGGRDRSSILADAVEAIIAAIYLDGGLNPARSFVAERLLSGVDAGSFRKSSDNKTMLQERLQRKDGPSPQYEVLDVTGPDHARIFTASVSFNGKALGSGTGRSKKEAEQSAAGAAMEKLDS